jgi:hypothetical protein
MLADGAMFAAGEVFMTDTIKAAAHGTAQILAETHNARLLLAGNYSTINTLGVLEQPEGYLAEMREAREAIDRAIAIHIATNWPSRGDYHAL